MGVVVPNRSLSDLEYNTILEEVSTYCLSEEGREELVKQGFSADKTLIEERQRIIDQFLFVASRIANRPHAFPPIKEICDTLNLKEKSLDGIELYTLALYLKAGEAFITYCHSHSSEEEKDPLYHLFKPLDQVLRNLLKEIESTLEGDGSVKASHPAIAHLMKQVDLRRSERSSYSNDFLRRHAGEAAAQLPVYRDGRVVLPIRSDQSSQVKGVIHSSSASGATLFIESYRLVELNNQVILAQQAIAIETARILRELTAKGRLALDAIYTLRREVAYGDSLYARSLWVERHGCVKPLITPEGDLILREARHPLLGVRAVPISLEADSAIKAVVISGPNAGGKTVTIKTVALFVLLHQSFYYIPAKEGSALPLYKSLYTDIGDEQSISESLSTFSGHMRNISSILRSIDNNSLILLDELGSGTDPLEGAALGRAILEYCVEKGSLTFVSSHHNLLKQYAYGDNRLLNMAMEADAKSHQPTFRVIKGVPGESYALETAKRMEIPPPVLDKASSYIGAEAAEISSIIKGLRQKEQEFIIRDKEIKEREKTIAEKQREVELKELSLDQREHLIRKGQLGDLTHFIAEKRSELENLVARLREGEITRDKTREVKSYLNSLDLKHEEALKRANTLKVKEKRQPSKLPLGVGSSVLVKKSKREGRIVRQEKDGKWVVAVGAMKFTLSEGEIEAVQEREKKPMVSYETSSVRPMTQIDVRGLTLDEALDRVNLQLEGALVHDLKSFSIIHGLGDGILSNGIQTYLRSLAYVSKFYFALPEDGGHGKTYVEL